MDALSLAQDLIRCPSVTPRDAGAMDVLQRALEGLGFACTRYPFGDGPPGSPDARVDNLYARRGRAAPNFCFAGHLDVVPPGEASEWSEDPFAATVRDGQLWGRGASDMKGAIGAMVGAVARLGDVPGSISFLITEDEEGPARHGTDPLLAAVVASGETLDHCLVGEPTNPGALGDMIKAGRRGSFNMRFEVRGRQGHVAYPHLATNPVPVLLDLLDRLRARELDRGNAHFQPSNLEVTSVDVGNPAHNVIPAVARAQANIRFNTEHRGDDLKAWVREQVAAVQAGTEAEIHADLRVTGEAFLTEPSPFTTLVQDAVESATGRRPELSTAGGTSDARYITRHCPVVEFGLVGATMHQIDERVDVADIATLTDIYEGVLRRYFDAYA